MLFPGRRQRVREVHALRVAVQLEQATRRRAGSTQGVEVEGVGLALPHEAPRRVADRVHPRVLRGAHQTAGQLLLALIESVVDGGHDVVRFGQHVVGQVELPALQDVELDALEDREVTARGVQGVDGPPLLAQPLRVEAERHRHALRMVRDGDVLVAQGARRVGHVLDRSFPIGGARVHLQVAANVLHLHEVREPMVAGERDLAARFAQLRRDPVEAELRIDLLFGLPGRTPRALEEAVLVQLVALLLGDLAQLDVVRLGAGEIQQRRTVRVGLHRPQVHLEAAPQLDRGPRLALRDDFRHVAVRDEPVHHRGAVPRRHQDIQVPDRLTPPPVAPRHLDLPDPAARSEMPDDRGRLGFGFVEEHAPLAGLRLAEPRAHLLFDLRPEPFELLDPALVERRGEVGRRFHLELLVEQLHAFGPETGNAQQVEQPRGELARELFAERQLPRGDDVRDLLGQVLADAGDVGQVLGPRLHQIGDRLGEIPNRTGRVAVRPHPERIRVLDLEEVRDLVEQAGDVGVLHRGR